MLKGWGQSAAGSCVTWFRGGCRIALLQSHGTLGVDPIPRRGVGALVPAHFPSLLEAADAAAAYASAGSLV